MHVSVCCRHRKCGASCPLPVSDHTTLDTLLSVVAQSELADSKENRRVSEAHEVQDCERLHQHCRTLPGEAQLPVVT